MKKNHAKIIAVGAILLFFFLALDSLVNDSPTFDEHYYIAGGLTFLRTGDPRFNYFHPPFVNLLIAAPLLTMPEIKLPLDHPSWQRDPGFPSLSGFADTLIWKTNRHLDLQRIFFLSRMPVVYLTIFLGLVGWQFSRKLWGSLAPVLVLLLILFDPNILAHGRYATTDLGGTLFAFLATYLVWRVFIERSWNWALILSAGFSIGLAFSSKYSNLIFLPVWGLLACLPLYGATAPSTRRIDFPAIARRIAQLAVSAFIGFFILWATYGFEWRSYIFQSARLQGLNAFSGPLPTYLSGLVRHLVMGRYGVRAFLMGQYSTEGFPQYFPIAFLVKTPMVTLLLLFIATILLLSLKITRKQALFLFIPVALFFLSSINIKINIGFRHLLPILPYTFMLIGGLGSAQLQQQMKIWLRFRRNKLDDLLYLLPGLGSMILILTILLIDFWIHPHYLSYFNQLAGGPANGHRVLVDSNIDWGQDLLRLKEWMAANNIERVKLSWFGSSDPSYYSLEYELLPGWPLGLELWQNPPFDPQMPDPGIYAISATNLWGAYVENHELYAWFQNRNPDNRIGYSILIFEVP